MTSEEMELLEDYQKECDKLYELANRMDEKYPTLPGAFTGTPSERIERHLNAIGFF